jgi:hypothetical protein
MESFILSNSRKSWVCTQPFDLRGFTEDLEVMSGYTAELGREALQCHKSHGLCLKLAFV